MCEGLCLESILDDPSSDLFKEFTTYLHQSYCIENLQFWLAAQEYNVNYYYNKHRELGESMINLYIKPNSPQEINIPCDMRQTILELHKQRQFHLHLFDDAAEAVLELMRVNSFLPWLQSSRRSSVNSGTRYKTLLKRVKKSLLGQNTENHHRKSSDSSILDTFFTPRSSFTEPSPKNYS